MAVSTSSKKLLLSLFCLTSIIVGIFNPKVSAYPDGHSPACGLKLKEILPRPYSDLSGLTCSLIWQQQFSFRFFQDNQNVTTIVLSGKHSHRWIGIGFSPDGNMVGSSAVVAWVERDGVSGIKQYYLAGKNMSYVIPDRGDLHFTSAPPMVVVSGDLIYIAFQLQFSNSLAFQPILMAVGQGNPHKSGLLPKHINSTTTYVEFASAHLARKEMDTNELRSYHGTTAVIGWAILTPVGGIIARYFRHLEPSWYYLHSSTQFVGFFVGIVSISIGRNLYHKMDARFVAHKFIGYSVFFLAGLEVCQFVGRPSSDSKRRQYWNFAHYWVGRTAMVMGVMNVFVGFHGIDANDGALRLCFGLAIGALLAMVVILEGRMRRDIPIPKTTGQPPVFQVVDKQ